jgi:hypothetical protein
MQRNSASNGTKTHVTHGRPKFAKYFPGLDTLEAYTNLGATKP